MATYYLSVKTISRGKGGCVTRAAAYRAGERIEDERTSDVFNFCNRDDVVHKEILLASQHADAAEMKWARDRSALWNAAEHAGRRRNALLAREVLVLLPPELTATQHTRLVRKFSQELADRYRNAVDVVIHRPRPGADQRHHHAHVLMTSREVTAAGLGPRTTLELSGTERHARGLGPSKNDYLLIRKRWAELANEALLSAGLTMRIDHRSLKEQGINREPAPAIPQKVYYAEKKSGVSTQAGNDIRARHRERVEARMKGPDEWARVVEKQSKEDRQRALEGADRKEASLKEPPRSSLTREERNEKRRNRHKANAQSLNEQRREKYRENIEVRREKDRTWRRANAEEVNRKRSDRRNAKLATASLSMPRVAAEDDPLKNWLRLREKERAAVAAKPAPGFTRESWNAMSHGERAAAADAAEDLKNWREYRERQKQAEESRTSARDRPNDHGAGAKDSTAAGDGAKGKRGRNNDFSL